MTRSQKEKWQRAPAGVRVEPIADGRYRVFDGAVLVDTFEDAHEAHGFARRRCDGCPTE